MFLAQNRRETPGSCAPGALSIRTTRRNAPNHRSASDVSGEASWRSGDAEDCKSLFLTDFAEDFL